MDLGSDVITEVEIQPQMEEVEIETEALEDDDDDGSGIEISVGEDMGLEDDDEVMLQAQEEIVGYDDSDMALVSDSGILIEPVEPPVPSSSTSLHHHHNHHHHHHHRKLLTSTRKSYHGGNSNRKRIKEMQDPLGSTTLTIAASSPPQTLNKAKKWEPKQVQIRTLEGEFSVTMWASGADDGKSFYNKLIKLLKRSNSTIDSGKY